MSGSQWQRPNPAQWIWYAFGGRLPQRYREWVLHDLTCSTWWLRQVIRALVQVLPVLLGLLVVFFFLQGPLWVILLATALGLIVSVYYSLSYMVESGDARLQKYDYPPQHGSHVRQEAGAEHRQEMQERYNAAWRHNSPQ